MSVVASDLIVFGAASRPNDDTSTSGGAIDTVARPLDQQLTANDTIDVVSDGADTRDVVITGRADDGTVVSETLTLSGTTTVTGTQTFERILTISLSAADTARTVTVSDTDAGDGTLHTFNPNETDAYIHFRRSSSESTQTTRYEKDFWKNTNGSTALQSATITLTADPSSNIQIAVEDAQDDTESVADRTTAPTGITADGFVDDGTAVSIPGSDLGAGAAIGFWAELTLAADEAAQKSSFTTEIAGETT